jgi:anti-sigma factor RsiW
LALLRDYVDGELQGDTRLRLEAHLRECKPCEDFVATYAATGALCRKALARQMPETVAAKLRAFLQVEIGHAAKSPTSK